MVRSAFILGAVLLLSACTGIRRDTPDETKVQSFPAWRPAPNDNLPTPQ